MKKITLIVLAALLLSSTAYSQKAVIRSKSDREAGYSRTEGDVTYNYTEGGRQIGYSRNVGDRTYDFDQQGRERGYSQTIGDTDYHYNKAGRERGYSQVIDSGPRQSPEDGSTSGFVPSSKSQNAPFVPTESNLWGYSNAGASKTDKPEEK